MQTRQKTQAATRPAVQTKSYQETNTKKNARFVFDLFDTETFQDDLESMSAYIPEKNDGTDMKTLCSVIKDFLLD